MALFKKIKKLKKKKNPVIYPYLSKLLPGTDTPILLLPQSDSVFVELLFKKREHKNNSLQIKLHYILRGHVLSFVTAS